MAGRLSIQGVLVRFLFAIVLVLATYNPTGYSYLGWLRRTFDGGSFGPLLVIAGLLLLAGWILFVGAARKSLGLVGFLITVAIFGTLLWLLIDVGIVPGDNATALTWAVLICFAGVLAVGVSWSFVRRRVSGQVDVDELS